MNGNHKPEMALALTEFEALHGFIGLKELKDVLCGVPEIVELIGKADAEQVLRANEHVGEEKVKAVLEFIFTQLMSSNKDTISELIFKIKPRLNMEKEGQMNLMHTSLVNVLNAWQPWTMSFVLALPLNTRISEYFFLCSHTNRGFLKFWLEFP